jgi:hypothetical protein
MTLTSLIERVEKCEGPDREIDALVYIALFDPDVMTDGGGYRGERPAQYQKASKIIADGWDDLIGLGQIIGAPEYTASLDAVVTLIEQALPGWEWLRQTPGVMTVYRVPSDPKEWAVHIDGVHSVPALALLLAFLKAKERQADQSAQGGVK